MSNNYYNQQCDFFASLAFFTEEKKVYMPTLADLGSEVLQL